MIALQNIVDRLKTEKNRSSTKKTYYAIWKKFNQFFIRLDRKPKSWEETLTLFVGFLIENNRKSTTIRSYISAIKSVLIEDGEELNENRVLLNSLTRACRIKNDVVTTRLPIRKGLLQLILHNVHRVFDSNQPFLVNLYRTLFSTAYFGLFRVGELTESQHVVKAKDVHIAVNKKKLMFVLHSSKTHGKDKKPQIIKITSSQLVNTGLQGTREVHKLNFCPYKLLNDYLAIRQSRNCDNEQFFVFRDKSLVTPYHFRCILRKVLIHLELDYKLYSTSSFRAGRASDLAEIGISVESIKFLGRWRSSAVFAYLKN